MKVYTFSQARQNLSKVLNESKSQQVIIRRRGGDTFRISPQKIEGSPFDVPPLKTHATTADILRAVRDSRRR